MRLSKPLLLQARTFSVPSPIEPIESHIKELAKGLSADGNDKAVNAIMTTDTVPKQYAVKFMLGDCECTVGGMAKGSGMIHPNMATTLNFITSDVAISSELIQNGKCGRRYLYQ